MGIPLKHPFEVVLTGSATIHCRQGHLPVLPASPWACLRPGVPRKKGPGTARPRKSLSLSCRMSLGNAAFQSLSMHAGPGSKPGLCHVKPKNRIMNKTLG
jgi:hypothetical protein